jgi:deoxyribodipyrimidine photo-lyase
MKKYKKSLFLFRRDLRLFDNKALSYALKESESVIPLFIFDPLHYDEKKNDYFSKKSFSFLLDSLLDLSISFSKKNADLFFLEGENIKVIKEVIEKEKDIDAVYMNEDYTPFAQKSKEKITSLLNKYSLPFCLYEDYALSSVKTLCTGNNSPYSVFTPFYKKALLFTESSSFVCKGKFSPLREKYNFVSLSFYRKYAEKGGQKGGREEGKKLLKKVKDILNTYEEERNFPSRNATTHLSPHHKYGTLSIRETYRTVEESTSFKKEQFLQELYWRDFYYHIAFHFPFVFERSFQPFGKYIQWENDEKKFSLWKEGKTGIPLIDAGMRELNETGFMHNRVRMIVASFLTKNMLISWQKGEKYFAQKLTDYDPAVNNGSWQWSASLGADPRPLRIFNPYTQALKYDASAEYIKHFLKECLPIEGKLLTDGKEKDFSLFCPLYFPPVLSVKDTYHRARNVYRDAKIFSKNKKT